MKTSILIASIILLLAASFASASSYFKTGPEVEEDFCFGYAICE